MSIFSLKRLGNAFIDKAYEWLALGVLAVLATIGGFVWIVLRNPNSPWFFGLLGALTVAILMVLFAVLLVGVQLRKRTSVPNASPGSCVEQWLHDIAQDQAETIHRFVHITRCGIGKHELFGRADPYIEFQTVIDNRSVYDLRFADPVGAIFFDNRELSGALTWTEGAVPTHGNEGVVTLKQKLDKNDVIYILNGREGTFEFTRLQVTIHGASAFEDTVRPQLANLNRYITNGALLEKHPKLDIQIEIATLSILHDHRASRAVLGTFFVTMKLGITSNRVEPISIDRYRLYLPVAGKPNNTYADNVKPKLWSKQYINEVGEIENLDYYKAELDNIAVSPLRFENGTRVSGGLQFTLGEMAMDDGTINQMNGRKFELILIDEAGEEHIAQGQIEWADRGESRRGDESR